jgi:hypothetical protein
MALLCGRAVQVGELPTTRWNPTGTNKHLCRQTGHENLQLDSG